MTSPTTQPMTTTTTATTMARVVFMVLFLVSVFATASASETEPQRGDKKCLEDNPDFRYKGGRRKNCDWVAGKRSKKQKRSKLCKQKAVRENCPTTCRSSRRYSDCEKEEEEDTTKSLVTSCPENSSSETFRGNCNNYETNFRCGYDHVYTGCNNNDMACSPTFFYSCENDDTRAGDETNKRWQAIAYGFEFCETKTETETEDKPYGESCDPTMCPPVSPLAGASCDWYKDKENTPCSYDTSKDDRCSPPSSEVYTCDDVAKTWMMERNVEDSREIPEECGDDTTTTTTIPLTLTSCPDTEPTPGSECDEDERCLYDYEWRGCGNNPLTCTAMTLYSCPNGVWEEKSAALIKCLSSNPLNETPCDPDSKLIL